MSLSSLSTPAGSCRPQAPTGGSHATTTWRWTSWWCLPTSWSWLTAVPFDWRLTRADLDRLLRRLDEHEHHATAA
jgi:hypothetical protein